MNGGDMRKIINLMENRIEEVDLENNPEASTASNNIDDIMNAINSQLNRVGLYLAGTNQGGDDYWYDVRETRVGIDDDADPNNWYVSDWKNIDEILENIQKDLANRGHTFRWKWLGSDVIMLVS